MRLSLRFMFTLLLVVFMALSLAACGDDDDDNVNTAKNIVEIAEEDGRFTTLIAGLEAADLVDTLSGDGPFTVFAPTDEAFDNLPDGLLDELLADVDQLTNVLTYHVYAGNVLAADAIALDGETIEMLNGLGVTIDVVDGNVVLNLGKDAEATVIITDIVASNGVIHVIDTVLNPADAPSSYTLSYAYLQYRSDEEGSYSQCRTWLEVMKDGELAEEGDFTNFKLFDSNGEEVTPIDTPYLWISPFPYLIYDCTVEPCTLSDPYEESGFTGKFNDDLAAGDYDLTVDTADGQTLSTTVSYPGQLILPSIPTASLSVEELANGDATLSWTNPTDQANWSEVDQLRHVFGSDNGDILVVKLNPDVEEITIPVSVVDAAENLSGEEIAGWTVQTRAYDKDGMNFSRGFTWYPEELQ
jgi:uncharacterized surface protein with fasciclin (FAS1) repeats